MRKSPFKIPVASAFIMLLIFSLNAFAQDQSQDQSPVQIVFDKDADRIDMMTGQQIPNYTQAQRGSIQFYLGRLDKPENGFYYFFDGRKYQNIDNLMFMRKMPSIGCWIIASRGRGLEVPTTHPKQNCEIIQHAVSFIPLDSSGDPQPRVYVLLEDLHMIKLGEYDHWLATDTQDEVDAKEGSFY